LGFPNRVVVCIPTGCCAPDHKHNDCELTFACFSGLRPEIQTIPLTEGYGHCSAPGSTALFSTIGALRAPVFSRLWRQNPSHPLCGWSLTQERLFELSKKGRYPAILAELAESFGMMLVKVEAREFEKSQMIEALEETKTKLEEYSQKLEATIEEYCPEQSTTD
jgi:hypothetical protein